jgi:mannose-1-phosphate guanylyltransferase
MFFWRADVLLSELDKHQPATARILRELPSFGSRGFAGALARVFPQCENVSIDYAVLEKASGVLGFAAGDIGWNDVGSFDAVYELLPKDAAGNASRGPALLESAGGNYIDAPGKTVALLGVRDLIVVDTADALLVCDRRQAQRVGDLVKMLEKHKRKDLL